MPRSGYFQGRNRQGYILPPLPDSTQFGLKFAKSEKEKKKVNGSQIQYLGGIELEMSKALTIIPEDQIGA